MCRRKGPSSLDCTARMSAARRAPSSVTSTFAGWHEQGRGVQRKEKVWDLHIAVCKARAAER